MKHNYPIFKIHKPSAKEIELANRQRPVLEKLSDAGYGIKVADDTYMEMPWRVDSDTLPLEVYRFDDTEPIFVQIFNKWEEIEEFASTIN